jgi:hypothetical protein
MLYSRNVVVLWVVCIIVVGDVGGTVSTTVVGGDVGTVVTVVVGVTVVVVTHRPQDFRQFALEPSNLHCSLCAFSERQ